MSHPTWASTDVDTPRKKIPTGGLGFVLVAVVCMIIGTIMGGTIVGFHLVISGTAALAGLLFAAAFVLVFILITKFFPGFRWQLALIAYLWGSTGALVLVTIGGDPWEKITSATGMSAFTMSFGGAYPEEIAKGFGALIIVWLWGKRPADGLLYGMWIGVGFEVFENYVYGLSGGIYDPNSDMDGVLEMWLLRVVAGPGLHILFSGMVGYGVASVLYGRYKAIWWILGGTAFHFVWNIMWDHIYINMGIVGLFAYPLFIWLFISQWREQARAAHYEDRVYIP